MAFSSEGTKDADNDKLNYEWKITSKAGVLKTLTEANPTVTFDKPGTYKATLKVETAGLRAVLCYEVTDRDGEEKMKVGI